MVFALTFQVGISQLIKMSWYSHLVELERFELTANYNGFVFLTPKWGTCTGDNCFLLMWTYTFCFHAVVAVVSNQKINSHFTPWRSRVYNQKKVFILCSKCVLCRPLCFMILWKKYGHHSPLWGSLYTYLRLVEPFWLKFRNICLDVPQCKVDDIWKQIWLLNQSFIVMSSP